MTLSITHEQDMDLNKDVMSLETLRQLLKNTEPDDDEGA